MSKTVKLDSADFGIKIRETPSFDGVEVGLVEHGDEVEVDIEEYSGFLKLKNGRGYVMAGDEETKWIAKEQENVGAEDFNMMSLLPPDNDSDFESFFEDFHTPRTMLASVPPVNEWPNRPLYICKGNSCEYSSKTIIEQPIKIHESDPSLSVIPIANEIFVGNIFLIIAGLPDSPNEYFKCESFKQNVFHREHVFCFEGDANAFSKFWFKVCNFKCTMSSGLIL